MRQNIICFILPIADVFNVMRLIMKYIAGSRGRRSIMDMALNDIINKVLPGSFGKKVPYRGKPAEECPDGPRYKALGNSMAVPVMRWIGGRIAMEEES